MCHRNFRASEYRCEKIYLIHTQAIENALDSANILRIHSSRGTKIRDAVRYGARHPPNSFTASTDHSQRDSTGALIYVGYVQHSQLNSMPMERGFALCARAKQTAICRHTATVRARARPLQMQIFGYTRVACVRVCSKCVFLVVLVCTTHVLLRKPIIKFLIFCNRFRQHHHRCHYHRRYYCFPFGLRCSSLSSVRVECFNSSV